MASDQPFSLVWNHHQTALVEIFNKLLSKERLLDCTLAAEGQYIKAHKVLLSACSPYFELLLSQHNDNHPIIILKDVTFRELKALVDYMYGGKLIVLSRDQLDAILIVAKNLQIKGLSDGGRRSTEPKEKPPEKMQLPSRTLPSAQRPSQIIYRPGLTIEHWHSNQVDHSQGSPPALAGSPVLRKRRRTRRRSGDNGSIHGHTAIESHQDSSSRVSSSFSIPANIASIPVSTPVAVIPDQPLLLGGTDDHKVSEPAQPTLLDIVRKTGPSTEMSLEPNHENVDVYMNETIVEDWSLYDVMNDLDQSQTRPSDNGSRRKGSIHGHTTIETHQDSSSRVSSSFSIPANIASTPVSTPVAVKPDQPLLLDGTDDHIVSEPAQPTLLDIVRKTGPSTEMSLEPNHENVDVYMNETIVEDWSLYDVMNDLDQSQTRPSGEGSRRKGFNPWRMKSDRSTDEVFMQAQQALGDKRESQVISLPEAKMNSNSDVAANISSQETVIFLNLANDTNDTSIVIPKPKKTSSVSKDTMGISPQQMMKLRNHNQEPNARLIKHLQAFDDIIGAGSTSAKEQIMMSELSSHLTSHVDEKTETIFYCEHCPKSFKKKKHLRRHLKYSNCKTELVECGQCSQQFNKKSSLIHHLQNKCGKQKQNMCSYCKRQFKFEKNLLNHMKRECGKINSYKCPKCQNQYLFRRNLNCHLKNGCVKTKELKCKMCNKQFVSKVSLDQHVRNDCGIIRQFTCLTCFKKYKNKSSLNAHMKHDCGRKEPHKCPQCQRLFGTKGSLNRHTKHDCGRGEPHKCPQCQRVFSSKQTLDVHLKSSCGKKEQYKCPSCSKHFKSKSSLYPHMKHDCGRTEPHKCPQCQRLYRKKTSLDVHLKHSCGKREPFKCPSCSKQFKSQRHLNGHMKHNCGKTEPHKCPQCQRLYRKKTSLDVHLKHSCGKKEPFKCPSCSKQFKWQQNLNVHIKHDCGKTEPHKCPQCQKMFVTKDSLNRHMKHDCGRKEPHKCPQCQKMFVTKDSLNRHMKHDCGRTEPHKCPQCQKMFVTKDSLNRHMKHDCGRTEPHKCPQCQRLYSNKRTLAEHLKNRCTKH